MEKKNEPQPPRFTASCSLLLSTLLVFGLVFYTYFFWYLKDFSFFQTSKAEKRTISVTPSDNFAALLQSLENSTILVLSPGKYSGNFRLERKTGIEILGTESTILESPDGIVLTLEDCMDCNISKLNIQGEDSKSPALFLIGAEGIVLKNLSVKSSFQAIKIQTKSQKIEIRDSHISGEIRIENCSSVVIAGNTLESMTPNPAISIESAMKVEIHKNKIRTKEGIFLKNIFAQENSNNTITQNTLNVSQNALVMHDCRDFLITWNEFVSEQSMAVNFVKCFGIAFGKSNFENKVKAKNGYALWMAGSKNIVLEDSWFNNQDTEKKAIYIESSSDIQILKSKISGLAVHEEGILKELKGGGILVSNTINFILEKSYIQESQGGIRIEKASQATMSHNQIQNNLGNGIEIQNSQAMTGPSNIVSQNHTGIVFQNSKGEILENSILENKEDGILLENSSPKVQKNQIAKNSDNGMRLKNNSTPSLFQNHFIQNKGFGICFSLQTMTVPWKLENFFEGNSKNPTDRMDTQ
ncbi:MAG: right-handed parallel beta-helix repeat-containing protein [Candidatus Brocadiae bacterium]|nr:right-handed parallel beta-helix repeat-containing protein [Candidatus Brocadiia bacterium]